MSQNDYMVAPWSTATSKNAPKLSSDARVLKRYRESRNETTRRNAEDAAERWYRALDGYSKGPAIGRRRAAERELAALASYNAQHPIEGRYWGDYATLPEVEIHARTKNNRYGGVGFLRNVVTPSEKTPVNEQPSTKLTKQTKYTAKPITGSSYKVKYGDTLSKIARRAGMTVKELAALNNIEDVNNIVAGQTLKLENIATRNAAKRAAEQVRNYYESNFADEPVDLSSLNESMPVSDEAREQYLTDAYNQGALNRYFDAMDYYGAPQQTMVQPQEDYSPIASTMTPQNVAASLYNNYWSGR